MHKIYIKILTWLLKKQIKALMCIWIRAEIHQCNMRLNNGYDNYKGLLLKLKISILLASIQDGWF